MQFEIVPITTGGDKVQDRPIADLGIQGVFVKELEEALYAGRVDLVVHSLKDLPTKLPPGLELAAVLDRADARDVLVSHDKLTFSELPTGSRVATSSRRRTAQLKALRPDLIFCDIRGNIQTRLKKHDGRQCDAMVLAAAGLVRLNLQARISEYFDLEKSTPAVGQGALAIECRSNDTRILAYLHEIDEQLIRAAVDAERAFLDKLGGGCSVPIGAYARVDGQKIELLGCVCALDGTNILRQSLTGDIAKSTALGAELAEKMTRMGATRILSDLLKSTPAAISPP
jgi:hydroxymethylbilane synthase